MKIEKHWDIRGVFLPLLFAQLSTIDAFDAFDSWVKETGFKSTEIFSKLTAADQTILLLYFKEHFGININIK